MRSDAIDQLLSTYLEVPARVSWKGALADSARGIFEGGRLELAGVAVLALPFDRLVLEAERFQFIPGIPARFTANNARITVSIDQRQVDRWLRRLRVPFELRLVEDAIEFRMDVAGFALSRARTELAIADRWFVLRPKSAELLGFQNRLATLFRTSLPLPRLAPQTRLTGVEHALGSLRLEMTLDDFEEEITPGLVDRMKERFLPFARPRSRSGSGTHAYSKPGAKANASGGSRRNDASPARPASRPSAKGRGSRDPRS